MSLYPAATRRSLLSASLVAACALLLAPSAVLADWSHLGEQQAGKEALEVTVNREVSKIRVICKAETLTINTIVVREGANKTPYTVAKKFAKNEEYVLDLGGRKQVTGLRISALGTGRFLLSVQK